MRRFIVALLMMLVDISVLHAARVTDFADFSLRASDNSLLMPARLYVPPGANSGAPRPLILFLHGSGESGINNTSQINGNIDNLLAEAKQRGAFLLAPQTNGGWHAQLPTGHAASLTEQALEQFNVDTSRVYVTGLSMGGGGVWNMVHRFGDMFAAAVPICAVLPSSDFMPAGALDEPIWAFHARNDTVVPVNNSRTMIDQILNAAAETLPTYPALSDPSTWFSFDSEVPDLHYFEMPFGGHGIWNYVYFQERMYDWMFSQVSVPEPSTSVLLAIACMLTPMRRRSDRSKGRLVH